MNEAWRPTDKAAAATALSTAAPRPAGTRLQSNSVPPPPAVSPFAMRSSVAFLALAACCASLCVVSAAAASLQHTPAALADKVTSLPGVDQMPGFNVLFTVLLCCRVCRVCQVACI